jgi:SAM-dependent methyltransferase
VSTALTLQAWLQERRYARPYHSRQRPTDECEYRLRTGIVLELSGVDTRTRRPRLLDVGCGDARFVADAARRASTVGIDISSRAVGLARSLVRDAAFLVSRGQALPFASESFDVVTVLDVIDHIPGTDERRLIAEARRVLRPGGRLVVSSDIDRSARELKHCRHYSVDRFRSLFDGLDGVQLVGLIPYFPTLRFWMAAPLVWRCVRSRVRPCAPDAGQVVIGVGCKM